MTVMTRNDRNFIKDGHARNDIKENLIQDIHGMIYFKSHDMISKCHKKSIFTKNDVAFHVQMKIISHSTLLRFMPHNHHHAFLSPSILEKHQTFDINISNGKRPLPSPTITCPPALPARLLTLTAATCIRDLPTL